VGSFLLHNVFSDDFCCRAGIRCDTLFAKLREVDWLIPADGELMRDLEGCEFEVNAALAVVVSTVFLVCSPTPNSSF